MAFELYLILYQEMLVFIPENHGISTNHVDSKLSIFIFLFITPFRFISDTPLHQHLNIKPGNCHKNSNPRRLIFLTCLLFPTFENQVYINEFFDFFNLRKLNQNKLLKIVLIKFQGTVHKLKEIILFSSTFSVSPQP